MADVRVDRSAFRRILTSPGVEAELRRRAERIAERAGDGFEVFSTQGRRRARAAVVAVSVRAKRGEAKDGRLSRALGAGRG
jgi:CRISPR/Cas system-associated endoribonuclease Cas2